MEELYLEQFAKKNKKVKMTVITARLEDTDYQLFKSYCDDLGLSINEAINLFVKRELQVLKNKKQRSLGEDESKNEELKLSNVLTEVLKNGVEHEEGENKKMLEKTLKTLEWKEFEEQRKEIDNLVSDDESKMNTKMNNFNSDEMNTNVIHQSIISDEINSAEDESSDDSGELAKSNSDENKKSNKRFTTKPFEVDKKLPCPICKDWFSASNFKRHIKDLHFYSATEEFFNEHKDEIEVMFHEKTGEKK